MADWLHIDDQQFIASMLEDDTSSSLVGRMVLDRLPYTFESKRQYLYWRDQLAEGLGVDGRDIALVGSAATGRSLSPRKQFRVFHSKSDLDIAVVSGAHFDRAWSWFRSTNPAIIGLTGDSLDLFNSHRSHYIFEGIIAANYFLQYLPFGSEWLKELQRSERLLPARLRGRQMNVRIYKDNAALRQSQEAGLRAYQRTVVAKNEAKGKEE